MFLKLFMQWHSFSSKGSLDSRDLKQHSHHTLGISLEVYNPCSVVAMDSFAKKHLFLPQTLTFFVHYHFAFCNDISIGGVMLNITSPALCQWIVITSYRSLGIHQMNISNVPISYTVHVDLQLMLCVMINSQLIELLTTWHIFDWCRACKKRKELSMVSWLQLQNVFHPTDSHCWVYVVDLNLISRS